MLEIIRGDFGLNIANGVANQFQHERIRSAGDRQRVGPERDLTGKSEKLRKIVELMADNLDEPLSAVQLAKSAGLSVRQVERLFLRHLTVTPGPLLHAAAGWSAPASCCARPTCRSSTWRLPPASPRIPISPRAYRLQFGRPPTGGDGARRTDAVQKLTLKAASEGLAGRPVAELSGIGEVPAAKPRQFRRPGRD